MAKSNKARQAEYRDRRRAGGLCITPGCDRKVRKYARCVDCRKDARERARERTLDAGMVYAHQDEIAHLRRELESAQYEAESWRRSWWRDVVGEDPN